MIMELLEKSEVVARTETRAFAFLANSRKVGKISACDRCKVEVCNSANSQAQSRENSSLRQAHANLYYV